MGKRSDFDRVPRDYYPTPIAAVEPLIPHLPYSFDYYEPCAGDGRLIDHIDSLTDGHSECIFACDIEPRDPRVCLHDSINMGEQDFLELYMAFGGADLCITNPPWDRKLLHPFIEGWMQMCPTWLLFDADWMHTKQSAILMSYCVKVVSVGRVKWIEDSKSVGKDNCAWYLFDIARDPAKQTEFYGRTV